MNRKGGFSLLEVLVALLLLGLIAAAVFAFVSGEIKGQLRMAERIRMLGAVQRTIDQWIHNAPQEASGELETDGFFMRWTISPGEKRRQLPMSGGRNRWVQLCQMRLEVFGNPTKTTVISTWDFLVNRWQSGEKETGR